MREVFICMNPVQYGVNISDQRYVLIKNHILAILEEEGPSCFDYVKYRICDKLFALFEGRVSEYIDFISNDLLRRRVIEKVPGSRTYKIRIKR